MLAGPAAIAAVTHPIPSVFAVPIRTLSVTYWSNMRLNVNCSGSVEIFLFLDISMSFQKSEKSLAVAGSWYFVSPLTTTIRVTTELELTRFRGRFVIIHQAA